MNYKNEKLLKDINGWENKISNKKLMNKYKKHIKYIINNFNTKDYSFINICSFNYLDENNNNLYIKNIISVIGENILKGNLEWYLIDELCLLKS